MHKTSWLIFYIYLFFYSRSLPENFNESWYIFLSVFTTLFIWIAFLPTYFNAFYAYHKSALLALALILNGLVVLICLFGPKVYALFYIEEGDIKISNFSGSSNSKYISDTSENGSWKHIVLTKVWRDNKRLCQWCYVAPLENTSGAWDTVCYPIPIVGIQILFSYFSLWILCLMLRYYQFKLWIYSLSSLFIVQSNYI